MNTYQKVKTAEHIGYKSKVCFVTLPSYEEVLRDLIYSLDEYESNYIKKESIYISTDMDIVCGNIILTKPYYFDVNDKMLGYLGKFEINLDQLYDKCKIMNIPIFVFVEDIHNGF